MTPLSAEFFYIVLTIVSGILVIIATGNYIVLVRISNGINQLKTNQALDSKTVKTNEKAIERLDSFTQSNRTSIHDVRNDLGAKISMIEFKLNYEEIGKERQL